MSFTEELLFGYLKRDGIQIDARVIKDAQNGGGEALWSIGYEYDVGKQQYNKAMAWFLLSAEKNYSHAQNNIGMLHRNGQGVHTDYLAALEWWLRAANQCNVLSFINIGDLFRNGHGVPENDTKAQQWYHINEVKTDKDILLKNLISETNSILITERRKRRIQLKEGNISSSRSNVSIEKTDDEDKEDEEKKRKRDELITTLAIDNQGCQQQKRKKQKNTDQVKQVLKEVNQEMTNISDGSEASEENKMTDDDTIVQLREKINRLQEAFSRKMQEVNSLKIAKEVIERERHGLKLENQQLKETHDTFQAIIRERESIIRSMKKRTCQSPPEDQDNEELKDTFKMLLKSQANEIELLKQNMELLFEREKKSNRRLKKENKELKRKIGENQLSMSSTVSANDADRK